MFFVRARRTYHKHRPKVCAPEAHSHTSSDSFVPIVAVTMLINEDSSLGRGTTGRKRRRLATVVATCHIRTA